MLKQLRQNIVAIVDLATSHDVHAEDARMAIIYSATTHYARNERGDELTTKTSYANEEQACLAFVTKWVGEAMQTRGVLVRLSGKTVTRSVRRVQRHSFATSAPKPGFDRPLQLEGLAAKRSAAARKAHETRKANGWVHPSKRGAN
jgi:hypothetical protein